MSFSRPAERFGHWLHKTYVKRKGIVHSLKEQQFTQLLTEDVGEDWVKEVKIDYTALFCLVELLVRKKVITWDELEQVMKQ